MFVLWLDSINICESKTITSNTFATIAFPADSMNDRGCSCDLIVTKNNTLIPFIVQPPFQFWSPCGMINVTNIAQCSQNKPYLCFQEITINNYADLCVLLYCDTFCSTMPTCSQRVSNNNKAVSLNCYIADGTVTTYIFSFQPIHGKYNKR